MQWTLRQDGEKQLPIWPKSIYLVCDANHLSLKYTDKNCELNDYLDNYAGENECRTISMNFYGDYAQWKKTWLAPNHCYVKIVMPVRNYVMKAVLSVTNHT